MSMMMEGHHMEAEIPEFHIPSAKALIGAALIQYLIYSAFYIIEGFKFEEFHGQKKETPHKKTNSRQEAKPQSQNVEAEEQKYEANDDRGMQPAELNDVELQEQENEGGEEDDQKPADQQQDESKDAEEEPDHFTLPLLMLVPKQFQQSTVWFMLILAFCALRTPNKLTVSLAFIQVFFRVVQLVGVVLHNRRVSQAAYGFATLCMFIMLFAVMAHGLDEGMLPQFD